MKCIHCGKEIRDSSNFCPFCGKTVERDMPKIPLPIDKEASAFKKEDNYVICENCSNKIDKNAKYCPYCGKKAKNNNEPVVLGCDISTKEPTSLQMNEYYSEPLDENHILILDDVKNEDADGKIENEKQDTISVSDISNADKSELKEPFLKDNENENCDANLSKDSIANESIKSDIENTETTSQGAENQASAYEQQLKIKAQKEKKVDNIEHVLAIILALFWMAKAGMTLEVDLLNAITTIVVGSLIEFLLIPFVNRYKKVEGIYKAQDKYDRYQSLKGSCDEQVIIQSIEIESSIGNQSKGLLYFLLCVIVILLLFAMF